MVSDKTSPKAQKSYHQLREELDQITAKLQSGDLDIDEALLAYKNGQKIIKELENYLKTAKNEVEKLNRK